MNFFEGLSRTQIAQKLNLPVGTVKSRVRLAFVRLKKLLQPPKFSFLFSVSLLFLAIA